VDALLHRPDPGVRRADAMIEVITQIDDIIIRRP
jgi:hypothetical protein